MRMLLPLSTFAVLLAAAPVFAKPAGPVKAADRACRKDSDCEVVMLRCQCMYCARVGDEQDGVVAAVNKKRAKAYRALGRCSTEQQRRCATAGPCAMTGKSVARCRDRACVADYVPFVP